MAPPLARLDCEPDQVDSAVLDHFYVLDALLG